MTFGKRITVMRLLVIFIAGFFAASCAKRSEPMVEVTPRYSPNLVHVIEQLRSFAGPSPDGMLPEIGGRFVGNAASPHEFYLLTPYFLAKATDADFLAMLKDSSPTVRVMAAHCLIKTNQSNEVSPLLSDETQLVVLRYGCAATVMTVSEVVAEMKEDLDYLEGPEEPNQALQPTPMSVTPPAAQEPRRP